MKLSVEQIRSVTFGALSVKESCDGIHFSRCTPKQIAAWGALHPDLGERATYSSGIVLDFHTNSKILKISTANGTSFDYYINGTLRATVNMKELRKKGEPLALDLCDPLGNSFDMCRVTVCFPRGNDPAVIENVELDDGAELVPHSYDRKFVFYGDSITQGCSSVVHSLCYTHMVSQFFNAECLNLGVGGGRFDASTVDDISYKPDTVVISFGTNDFTHHKTLEALTRKADEFMAAVKAQHSDSAKHFFVISPLWRADLDKWGENDLKERTLSRLSDARQAIINAAQKYGMIHIDGLSLVPPFPEYFRDQYLHPNDLGFSLYAMGVIKEMLKYGI